MKNQVLYRDEDGKPLATKKEGMPESQPDKTAALDRISSYKMSYTDLYGNRFDVVTVEFAKSLVNDHAALKKEVSDLKQERHDVYVPLANAACNYLHEYGETNFDRISNASKRLVALEAVAEHCEKLRLVINALLTELPDKSVVNGEDNFPFRLKVLKAQASAEKAQSNLAAIQSNGLIDVPIYYSVREGKKKDMKKPSIKKVIRNYTIPRSIVVNMASGNLIRIEPCHESWEQFGSTNEELQLTAAIAEQNNDWLHGGI